MGGGGWGKMSEVLMAEPKSQHPPEMETGGGGVGRWGILGIPKDLGLPLSPGPCPAVAVARLLSL